MAWATLASMRREVAARAASDAALEAMDCPDCCQRLVERGDGTLFCTFDGYTAQRLRRA